MTENDASTVVKRKTCWMCNTRMWLVLKHCVSLPGAPKDYNDFSDVIFNQNVQYSADDLAVAGSGNAAVGEGFSVITADACNLVVRLAPKTNEPSLLKPNDRHVCVCFCFCIHCCCVR